MCSRTLLAVSIAPLTRLDELAGCVDLQRIVFGYADLDVTPVRVLVLMREVGGLVLGARDGDALVGFVSCVPGLCGGRVFWHSHMMCVLPVYQNAGIGTALKHAQRAEAERHGVGSIQWVFDPLVPRNGHLNLVKLGAVARRYSVNHYGAGASTPAGALESDRLIAEWDVAPRLRRLGSDTRTVAIPADAHALARTDPQAARVLQRFVRDRFLTNLTDGFIVVGCERRGRGVEYVLRQEV